MDSKAAEQDGRRLRGFTTRAKALEVAAELFASQGYSATSISSIAQAAGLHAASLYHAFGSKEGLLAAVVQHASDEFYGYLEAMGDQLSPSAAISRLADALESRPLFLRLLLILVLEREHGDPALLQTAVEVRERGRAMIRSAIARHLPADLSERQDQRLEDFSHLLMAFLDGIFIAQQVDVSPDRFRRLFELIAEAMRSLFAADLFPDKSQDN
ncbi:TetR/AcrR family transcriptional regulator [Mycobacterium sp. 134]|uniref:TetR/AcrR family transcriptional regulator n=1 Tax=Mycobacterium sp. 134 TaxID=3400425 RepID=UPI003AAC15A5